MRRTSILGVALVLAVVPLLGTLPAEAALTVPGGFTVVDYDTGQDPFELTNFAWVGHGDLLTTGKDGTVTFVPSGASPRVLTKVPNVRAVNDHGLLGLAPANDYATTGRVFLSYDKGDPKGIGYGMLEEWKASPAANPTSFTRVRAVIDGSTMSPQLTQTGTTHGVDTVLVAPDNSLYWSIGDNAGNNGDPNTFRAQDLDQPYGKVLHVSAAGSALPSNPFYRSAAPASWRSMVYAYGMRNPFRISLDPRSGVLHVGDVGWRRVEEIDMLPAGANAGWPCYEGNDKTTFSTYDACQALYTAGTAVPPIWTYTHSGSGASVTGGAFHTGTAVPPIWTYTHSGSGASVTGGAFYTGTAYPVQYRNTLFFGDYTRQQIWTLATDASGKLTRAPEVAGFGAEVGGPVAFHAGPSGDMTYADILSGQVRRLVYAPGNRKPVAQLTTSVDAATRTVTFSAAGSYDLDHDELTYSWAFGDNGTDVGESVRHTYASADPVTVTLTIRDQLGAEGVTTARVNPANYSPVVALTAPTGRLYAVGDVVDLRATATDQEDGALTVTWEAILVHCPFTGSCH